jgi:hypothetical protein
VSAICDAIHSPLLRAHLFMLTPFSLALAIVIGVRTAQCAIPFAFNARVSILCLHLIACSSVVEAGGCSTSTPTTPPPPGAATVSSLMRRSAHRQAPVDDAPAQAALKGPLRNRRLSPDRLPLCCTQTPAFCGRQSTPYPNDLGCDRVGGALCPDRTGCADRLRCCSLATCGEPDVIVGAVVCTRCAFRPRPDVEQREVQLTPISI